MTIINMNKPIIALSRANITTYEGMYYTLVIFFKTFLFIGVMPPSDGL